MSTKLDGLPRITELEPQPCNRWSVDRMDGTPVREVTMRTDHELHGEVFECSCGECWSWSAGVDVGEQCVHILVVALMLMPDM